eukprot:6442309-Prymnesium_polylepis.1
MRRAIYCTRPAVSRAPVPNSHSHLRSSTAPVAGAARGWLTGSVASMRSGRSASSLLELPVPPLVPPAFIEAMSMTHA